jgi:hypothetical protein
VAEFHLLQALEATRGMAAGRDDPEWRALAADAESIIDQITAREHTQVPGERGRDELLRGPTPDDETTTDLIAALRALEERPDDDTLATARARVGDLAGRLT